MQAKSEHEDWLSPSDVRQPEEDERAHQAAANEARSQHPHLQAAGAIQIHLSDPVVQQVDVMSVSLKLDSCSRACLYLSAWDVVD